MAITSKFLIKSKKPYTFAFLLSFIVHTLLLLLLFVSLDQGVRKEALPKPAGEIIHASVVDQKLVEAEVERLTTIEKKREADAKKKEREMEDMAKTKLQEEEKLAEIKLAKEKEKKELKQLKDAQEKEKKRLALLEEKRKATLEKEKREKEIAQKKEAQKEAEAKKSASTASNVTQAQEEENPNAAPGHQGSARDSTENAKALSSEIEKYDAMMRHKINQCWIRPPSLQEGLSCELYARLLPDGSVMNPEIKKTSGNVAFDQAAISALQNASPLPVPTDPNLMDEFRQFNFKFSPPEEV